VLDPARVLRAARLSSAYSSGGRVKVSLFVFRFLQLDCSVEAVWSGSVCCDFVRITRLFCFGPANDIKFCTDSDLASSFGTNTDGEL
jgi:hypothetical protein